MADATKSKEPALSSAKGLEGVVIGSSSVSLVEGTEGRLSYRGYKIQDLAANSSYEEVLYLLLYGELPTSSQLKDITNTLRERRELPGEAWGVLRVLSKKGEPIDVLRTVVSSLALIDPDVNNTSREAVVDKTLSLAAKMPTIAAAYDRMRDGKEPVTPSRDLGHAANLLYMIATHSGPLSVVVTLASLYPASTVLLARVVLHERLSWRQWVGVVCAMIAVMAIVR